MIARYQTILFGVLLAASLVMGAVLWQLRERAHQRLLQGEDSAPTQAPQVAPAEQATLLVANDADNSLQTQVETLPLPLDPGARARLILGKLLELYAAPDAAHPIPGGGIQSVAQVFLMPVGGLNGGGSESRTESRSVGSKAELKLGQRQDQKLNERLDTTGPEIAVVNLTSAFLAAHPSGLEAETLTLESICGTLHANLPRITQVRFLVDGQVQPTLGGHADLTRTYLAADAVPTAGEHP